MVMRACSEWNESEHRALSSSEDDDQERRSLFAKNKLSENIWEAQSSMIVIARRTTKMLQTAMLGWY